jgi:ribonuclease D
LTTHTKPGREALVTREEGIHHAVDAARSRGSMAIDTEFMRERTYFAKLCLIQIEAAEHIYLIDPLEDVDLTPVGEAIADPDIEVLVHAGKQDLDIFNERLDVIPSNVFDVQVAASFAGFGANLPYGRLVEAALGVALEKGESYTDWCRRPLTEAQLRYAADDVRYLHGIAERLKSRLGEFDRLSWVMEELRSSFEDPTAYDADENNAWRKVAGRGALKPRNIAVLREVAAWREHTAAQRDLPRGWIVKDPTLIEIARRMPQSADDLRAIRGLNEREVERSGRELLEAVRRGRGTPPPEAPPQFPRNAQVRARMTIGLADALVRARCEKANISSEAVTTRGELESVLTAAFAGTLEEDSYRLLRGWRRDLAGAAILDLAHGKIGLRVVDKPPYVEETEG